MNEETLVLVKPDGVRRKLVGAIIQRFEQEGFCIIGLRVVTPNRFIIENHLPRDAAWVEHLGAKTLESYHEQGISPLSLHASADAYDVGNDIRKSIFHYYMQGPMVAMVLSGEDAVSRVRAMVGHTLPWKATPGTIRGDFSLGEQCENTPGTACVNMIHASDSVDSALWREIPAWFSESDLVFSS